MRRNSECGNPLLSSSLPGTRHVIPTLPDSCRSLAAWLVPGGLVNVGPMVLATGGAVSNTGLALYRLGIPVRLMGKVGDDTFGRATLDVLRRYDPALADGMLVAAGEYSSYTLIFSSPGWIVLSPLSRP